ncbi:MAG: glucose-1-phosphate thymidylyltransferase [Candidatus Aminicenantia bacterium]
MKGLILSGGHGTRLRPITHTQAKQLIPVANKPVLFYGIEALSEAGIEDIGIVVGNTKNEIMEAVGDGSLWGVKVTYIYQPEPLGLAHAVMISEDFLKDSPFVMYLGDNILKRGIKKFVEEFEEKKPNSLILLSEVKDPEQFGVAEIEDGKVKRLIEKPKDPPSNLALVGVYIFDKNIFRAVKNIKPSWRNELEITDAIQYLVENGFNVLPHIVKGWWKDTGKLDDILEANRLILEDIESEIKSPISEEIKIEGRVKVGKNCKIKDSYIRGPAIIGDNCELIDSYIGPFTSIENNCFIRKIEIENSIILSGTLIDQVNGRIERSLIGRNCKIRRDFLKPKGYRLMLGENSEIGLE